MDDVDSDNSVSMTWEIDPASGTMRHKKTGTKVSTDSGITRLGQLNLPEQSEIMQHLSSCEGRTESL